MSVADLKFTVLQVVNEVQRKLGLNTTPSLTTNKLATELIDHINDTVDDLSDFGNWMEMLSTAKVTAQVSVRDYVIQVSGVIKNIGDIYIDTRKGPLRSTDIDTMRIMTRSTALGQPSQYCIFGVDASSGQPIIRVRPTPDLATSGSLFSILYYKKPSQYTTSDTNTIIPYPARVVVLGVLARYTLRESGGAQTEMYQVYQQGYETGRRNALNRFNSDTGWDVSFSPARRNRWRR